MEKKREIQHFALILGLIMNGFSLYKLYMEHSVHWLIFPGTIILVIGLFVPMWLRIPYAYWMKFAAILSKVMTTLILSLIYFLVLTPIGLLAKIVGKSFLDVKISGNEKSYWRFRKPQQSNNTTHLENQF